jgi:hypothetical protein
MAAVTRRSPGQRSRRLGALGALLLPACTQGDPLTHTAEPITGGTADTEHVAVVALVRGDGLPWCSGSVIGEHTVLTAGHCVDTLQPDDRLQVFFGDSIAAGGTLVAVSDTAIHPDFDRAVLAHDLALLTLREAAPVPLLPLDARPVDASLSTRRSWRSVWRDRGRRRRRRRTAGRAPRG